MVFSVPTFTTVGDDYDKKHVVDERSKGRNFVAVAPKQGKLPDALFEKTFKSLHEGDPFVEQLVRERRHRNDKARARVSGAPPFRVASNPAKPTGRGDFHGTFSGAIPHETDYVVPRKGDVTPKRQPGRRPIFTAPCKKGGYGVPGITLSRIGEDYISDFYENHIAVERQRNKLSREMQKGNAFKPCGRRGGAFDEGPGTGASQCYKMTQAMAPVKAKSGTTGKAPEAPWRPAGPAPKAIPVVEYREDPYGGIDPRVPTKKKKMDTAKAAFKPSGGCDNSWYTKSIAFARL